MAKETKASKTMKKQRKMRQTIQGNIPQARTQTFKNPTFQVRQKSRNAQTIIASGVDLVNPIPIYDNVTTALATIFLAIPANPIYWKGTRIASIAQAYQQYRPLKFRVKYVPSVPVTVAGQVVYGTLWNVGAESVSLQQSLATSNGGGITTCYQYAWSNVKCDDSTLPLKYYNMGDEMSKNTTNPFTWLAYFTGSVGTQGGPGYVIVHWTYEFTVGIGQTARSAVTYNDLQALIDNAPQWGVRLGDLKKQEVILYRKTAIMLLHDTNADLVDPESSTSKTSTVLTKGTVVTWDASNPLRSQDTSVLSSNDTKYWVSDNTLGIVWSCGQELTLSIKSSPEPISDVIKFISISGQSGISSLSYLLAAHPSYGAYEETDRMIKCTCGLRGQVATGQYVGVRLVLTYNKMEHRLNTEVYSLWTKSDEGGCYFLCSLRYRIGRNFDTYLITPELNAPVVAQGWNRLYDMTELVHPLGMDFSQLKATYTPE